MQSLAYAQPPRKTQDIVRYYWKAISNKHLPLQTRMLLLQAIHSLLGDAARQPAGKFSTAQVGALLCAPKTVRYI